MLGSVLRQLATLAHLAPRLPRFSSGPVDRADQAREVTSSDPGLQLPPVVRSLASNAQPGLIDTTILAAFLADRTLDRSQRVLGIFVRELAEKIVRLKESIKTGDAAALRAVVHSARGSSMLVGAASLAQESQRLEQALQASGRPEWDAAARLATTMAETHALYEALLASNLGGRAESGRAAVNAT